MRSRNHRRREVACTTAGYATYRYPRSIHYSRNQDDYRRIGNVRSLMYGDRNACFLADIPFVVGRGCLEVYLPLVSQLRFWNYCGLTEICL